ncbi:unnamed protein product [Caenorhabditis sp. 36 PRJEB53466]|nr:unnamed protein product [Caenorhabditis sp. 36 PRJEB53466]
MSDEPEEVATPQRTSKRKQVRVNYNEGGDTEAVFRSPTASTRGRKKRQIRHDVAELSANFGALNSPKRGRPHGATFKAPNASKPASDSEPSDQELVSAVKSGKKILEAVDRWIERYNDEYMIATAEIQQFFFAICGCKGKVTPQMSATLSFKDIICRMTEDFEEESADYPLVHGGALKKIRTNLHTFLHLLVDHMKSSLLFDHTLMDGLVQLLTGMADSQVRAFRHTSTFCALKLTSALVDVTIELTESKMKTMKQIEAEKAKMKQDSGVGNEKYEALVAQKTQTEERAEEIRQIIGYLFRSVFVHRYRDVVPDIRSICITELGHWMNIYPEHFIEDSYLKYIGWTLFDKVGDVRLKCIRALIPLFEKHTILDKIELFCNKFKDRLVSMVLDKDTETSIETCQLLRVLYEVFPTLLSKEDCIPIYELCYATNRSVAIAAGQFLNRKVFSSAEQPTKVAIPKNALLIKDLIVFFMEGDCHDHATYLVDALIDTSVIVKDWATMADMLLDDSYGMDPTYEGHLIEILSCAVTEAATGEQPIGRSQAKKNALSAKDNRDIQEEMSRLTDILMPLIPRLFAKFGSDKEKVIRLASIPINFDLTAYGSARMHTHLTELIDAVDDLTEKHVDDETLRSLAEIHYNLMEHRTTSALVEGRRMKLLDGIAAFLRNSVQKFENNEMGEEEEAQFVAYLKRMAAFSGFIDLRHWNLWDLLLNVVSNFDCEESKQKVQDLSIRILFVQLIYDLINLKKETETVENLSVDQVRKLKKRRDQLIRIMCDFLEDNAAGVNQAYLSACDLMIMLNGCAEIKGLETLVWRPDDVAIGNLKMFLRTNVFEVNDMDEKDQTEKIEVMHQMRRLVAQYIKLIIHGCLPISAASELMCRYQSHFQDFGDLFKSLIAKCRELNFIETGVMIIETLKSLFLEMESQNQTDANCEDINELHELARRLSSVFGQDYSKNRYALASLHKKAIDFAFTDYDQSTMAAPPNILFLEVAMEFSSKLLNQDKVAVHRYLLKIYSSSGSITEWEPFRLYSISLTDRSLLDGGGGDNDDDDAQSVRSERSNTTMSLVRGRGRGARRQ